MCHCIFEGDFDCIFDDVIGEITAVLFDFGYGSNKEFKGKIEENDTMYLRNYRESKLIPPMNGYWSRGYPKHHHSHRYDVTSVLRDEDKHITILCASSVSEASSGCEPVHIVDKPLSFFQ